MSGFSIPAFQDPPWFHLLFCPWVTTFLPLLIFRANYLAPFDTLLMSICLFPFSGIREPSLKGKVAMTTLASSGCTGGSWGSGFPCLLSVRVYLGRKVRLHGTVWHDISMNDITLSEYPLAGILFVRSFGIGSSEPFGRGT